jgi:hypothetical protein
MMSKICLYFRNAPEKDRWLPGDRYFRPLARRIVRGRPRMGGVDKVFHNLCLGLDRLGIPYVVNLPFRELQAGDWVGVLGRDRYSLEGYDRENPIVAGIGLMNHPSEWPTLCEDFPVVRYLQHSEWANNIYKSYFKDKCQTWPVGIDTALWVPSNKNKQIDFLIYNKILWDKDRNTDVLLNPLRAELISRGLSFIELNYGCYDERQYKEALQSCRYMLFLCEHESQGIAYLECLSVGVPILAWDQGWCLDPNRFAWGQPHIPASSVPFFDRRCGLTFRNIDEFPDKLTELLDLGRSGTFAPRDYVTEGLTLEKCSSHFLRILRGSGCKASDETSKT